MNTLRRRFLLAVAALVACAAGTAAQDIVQRLSIKFINDGAGNPPQGEYGDPAKVQWAIDQSNAAFERFGRGYGYEISEFRWVDGFPSFYDVEDDAEYILLGEMAQQFPAEFHWSETAVNVYIVDTAFAAKGLDPVMIGSGVQIDMIWVHELAHYNGLPHTWEDLIADTASWPGPLQCTENGGSTLGGTEECGCATKVAILDQTAAANGWTQKQYDDIRFNALSYFGDTSCDPAVVFGNLRLTEGQMDRWTDWTRLAHPNEVSGLTHFVEDGYVGVSNGLSTHPYSTLTDGLGAADAGGGDIVLLRAGTYDGPLTVSDPVVLRASLGSAVVGG